MGAGITISGSFLARGYTSPVTLGILIGYVAGKPIGMGPAGFVRKIHLARRTRSY